MSTFRRHETTMDVTEEEDDNKDEGMGRVVVAQLRVCSENGDRSAASTSQQKQWRGCIRRRVVYSLQCVKLEDMSSAKRPSPWQTEALRVCSSTSWDVTQAWTWRSGLSMSPLVLSKIHQTLWPCSTKMFLKPLRDRTPSYSLIYVTHTHQYLHTTIYVTSTHQYLSLEHTNIERVDCRLTVPHTCQSLPTINQLLISTVYW